MLSPNFLILNEIEIVLKPLNNSQNPINKEKITTVIPGYFKRMNPTTISRIPPARYRPKFSISSLLVMAKHGKQAADKNHGTKKDSQTDKTFYRGAEHPIGGNNKKYSDD